MKVLFFAKRSSLENVGGPSGYMYNISEYLKNNPNDKIEFLREEALKKSFFSNLESVIYKVLCRIFSFSRSISDMLKIYSFYFRSIRFSKETIDYLNSYDFIHIHVAPAFLLYFKKNQLKAKIILTSHSPEPYSDEVFTSLGFPDFYNKHECVKQYFRKKEVQIYDRCDHIMFPVAEAKEPYEELSTYHKAKFNEVVNKFFYVPTALYTTEMISDNDHILEKLCINDSTLNLCYVGRHNHIKGYDFLRDSAKEIWATEPDVNFIIGGKEDPMKGLPDNRWHELGWVKTPNLLNEVDAFILPNKNTYYDLILLEVLRQGTPVILTRTGGNKWFENQRIAGMYFFEYGDTKDLLAQISKVKQVKMNNNLELLKVANREFCKKECNMAVYIDRYLNCLEQIINNK